jgi:hypothetical protein
MQPLKPVLYPRTGTLSLDGTVYLAPKVSALEPLTSIGPLNFLGPIDREIEQLEARIDHSHCKSGSCAHAMRPRCKGFSTLRESPQICGCHGIGHQRARVNSHYRSIEEFSEGEHEPPSPNVGLWS